MAIDIVYILSQRNLLIHNFKILYLQQKKKHFKQHIFITQTNYSAIKISEEKSLVDWDLIYIFYFRLAMVYLPIL